MLKSGQKKISDETNKAHFMVWLQGRINVEYLAIIEWG